MAKKRPRSPQQKRAPQRMCVACRGVAGKQRLVRVVRTVEGVQVDPSGKLSGRGAYLHPYRCCWEQALRTNQLSRSLRTSISEQDRQALESFAATLPLEEQTEEIGDGEA